MVIRLRTGKGAIPLNKALKDIITRTASKVLLVDLSKSNMLTRIRLSEAVMQAIVATTLKIQIADFLVQLLLLRTRILPPPPHGEEGVTSRTFNGLQEMQVLTVEAVVNIVSNPLQAICKLLHIRSKLQVKRMMMTTHSDLPKTYKLRIRAKKT